MLKKWPNSIIFYLNITYFKRIFSKKYNFFPKMPRIIAAISVVVKFFP